MTSLHRFAVIATALALSGCSATNFFKSPTSLSDEWSKQMVQFRIAPVFPPGQDVQIGDVFISCTRAIVPGDSGMITGHVAFPIRLERIPGVAVALDTHYQDSVQLLPDANKPSLPAKTGFVKLRNLSLPEFFQVRASGSQLSALLPVGTTLAGFGLSTEDVESVDVSITSAGSAALPLRSMRALVLDKFKMSKEEVEEIKARYQEAACASANLKAEVLVVSEIYAAYSIALSINAKKSSAASASLALTLPSDSTRKAAFEALSQYFKPSSAPTNAPTAPATPAPAAATAGLTERDKAFVSTLKTLMGEVQDSYQMDHPGVSVSVYKGTTAGIRMDRTFSEPVVIGFRFLELIPGNKPNEWSVGYLPAIVAPPQPAPASPQ